MQSVCHFSAIVCYVGIVYLCAVINDIWAIKLKKKEKEKRSEGRPFYLTVTVAGMERTEQYYFIDLIKNLTHIHTYAHAHSHLNRAQLKIIESKFTIMAQVIATFYRHFFLHNFGLNIMLSTGIIQV